MCPAPPDPSTAHADATRGARGLTALTDVFLRGPRAYRSLSSYRSKRGNSRKELVARETPWEVQQSRDTVSLAHASNESFLCLCLEPPTGPRGRRRLPHGRRGDSSTQVTGLRHPGFKNKRVLEGKPSLRFFFLTSTVWSVYIRFSFSPSSLPKSEATSFRRETQEGRHPVPAFWGLTGASLRGRLPTSSSSHCFFLSGTENRDVPFDCLKTRQTRVCLSVHTYGA